jgi:hypothetical protein
MILENDPAAQAIAKENGLRLENAYLYVHWNADPDACHPSCCEMVNSAEVECHCAMCGIIDVVGVGLIEWYGCCGWDTP